METPTTYNPLGAKGIGESGTIGSTPAVQSAIVDAVAHLGVRHIDMPASPQRIWEAIQGGRQPRRLRPDIYRHFSLSPHAGGARVPSCDG